MSDFTVDFNELHLSRQLLDRQHEHVNQLARYSSTHLRIDQFDFGLILQVFFPLNELVVIAAEQTNSAFSRVINWSASQTQKTLDAYLEADEAAHNNASKIMSQLGSSPTPYAHPSADFTTLGSATSSAVAGYGDRNVSSWSVVNTVLSSSDIGANAAALITETIGDVTDRASTLGSRSGVVERSDPSSYLVTPNPGDDPGGELRLNAGLILGGCDWVAQRFLGISILEEYIYKPFGGDWHAIGRASSSWEHGSKFYIELAGNFSGLPGQMNSWTGPASVAFQTAMTAFAAASYGLSAAYQAVSGMVDTVGAIAKLVCSLIATALRKISNKLLRMAAEAAIPIAGWAVAAVEGVVLIGEIIAAINLVVNLINMLLDAVVEFIAAKERLVQASLLVEDLVTNIGRRALTS